MFAQLTVNANANEMNIVLSNISPMAIAPIDLYPTFPSSDLSLIILVNLAFTKLPTIYEIKDAINILGVCENMYTKLSVLPRNQLQVALMQLLKQQRKASYRLLQKE